MVGVLASELGGICDELVAASGPAEHVPDSFLLGGELGVRHVDGHPANGVRRVGERVERSGGEVLRAALTAEVVGLADVAGMRGGRRRVGFAGEFWPRL